MNRAPRLLLASFHRHPDPSSGAAVSALTLLEMLARRGWQVWTTTGPLTDAAGAPPPDPERLRGEAAAFLARYARRLEAFRPDVVLTYGAAGVGRGISDAAADRDVPVAFWLRNASYRRRETFARCALILVPSPFAAEFYRRTLGLNCTAIPSPIVWAKVRCGPPGDAAGRGFVTFVNPHPTKGAALVAGLAAELGRRRPDVRILVVEARAAAAPADGYGLGGYGADLSAAVSAGTLSAMPNVADPRRFYRRTRLLLTPSVWAETFGRVAAEGLINGLPVLASDRGALPETVGAGGLVLPLPADLTPATRTVPPAAALEPWLDALLDLWDDPARRAEWGARARAEAARFDARTVGDRHDAALRGLL